MPDYSINVPDPGERLLSGLNIGQGIANIENQRRVAIAEQTRQAALTQSMTNLMEMERPNFSGYEKVITQLPKDQAEGIRKNWELKSKEYQSGQLRNAGQIYAAFDASPDLAIKMMRERAEAEKNAGNDEAADVLGRWADVAEINPKLGKNTIGMMVATLPGGKDIIDSINKLQGRGRAGAGEKAFAPITLVNPNTGEKRPFIPTFDPVTGKARLEPANLPEGFQVSKETAGEKRQAELALTGGKEEAKVTGKGIGKRRQETIDKGLQAAGGMANLARAKSLLDAVATGGVAAASIRAKQLFGIEGADEAELSNRLSKAVLSQLRATFGAAFTAQEGAQLTRIEAGIGKSTEGNKRIIEQSMKLIQEAARKGIIAAEKAGDKQAAQNIKDALEFRLDVQEEAESELSEAEIAELAELKQRFGR
jgi:hypothetical protein